MGGHDMPKVPDWRVYKVENGHDIPKYQKTLKSLGIKQISNVVDYHANPPAFYLEQMKQKHGPHYKDPWIRNEIWKFNRMKTSPVVWRLVTPYVLGTAFAVLLKNIEWSLSGHDDHH